MGHYAYLKERDRIRVECRHRRQALSSDEKKAAAKTLRDNVMHRLGLLAKAEKIGVFIPHDGEIDTCPIIRALWAGKKCVCLPIVHPFSAGHLLFQRYTPNTRLVTGRFGIASPQLNIVDLVLINEFDVLLVPLVAFDRNGHRLGRGAGYYDRTLSCCPKRSFLVIGIAYSCQEVASISAQCWDRPVHEIITDKNHIICC